MNIYIVERWYIGYPDLVDVLDLYADKEEAKAFVTKRMQCKYRKFDYGVRKKTLKGNKKYWLKPELSLVNSIQKNVLEVYLPILAFTQRKNFAEWYVSDKKVERELSMDDMEVLGKHFDIEFEAGWIYLRDKK